MIKAKTSNSSLGMVKLSRTSLAFLTLTVSLTALLGSAFEAVFDTVLAATLGVVFGVGLWWTGSEFDMKFLRN